jgi:transposase
MAYSIDFRRKAIEYWESGHTKEELYEAFGIYPSRVYMWRKLEKETGALKPQYPKTRLSKINLQELEVAVERKPDDIFLNLRSSSIARSKQFSMLLKD